MSELGYISLYDNNWNALGKWTQHICKEWSLTRKALESDEFTATCQGYENSKNACFVGLHSETGALRYVAFCGIPKTVDKYTTITGIDCRNIFNQELIVDYSEKLSNGNYKITTVAQLFTYLMSTVFTNNNFNVNLPTGYEIDVTDVEDVDFIESYINRSKEIRNVLDQLNRACSVYDLFIKTNVILDTDTNKYKLKFEVRRIFNEISIKLSDFDAKIKLNQNIVNRITAYDGSSKYTYYLYNDNTIGTNGNDVSKLLFPPVHKIIFKENDLAGAKAEAVNELGESRYKDKVTIDLNSKFGSTLIDVDFTYFGNLVGYNPADDNSIKKLPVFSIKESSDSKKSITFGRLSDFWFMDRE